MEDAIDSYFDLFRDIRDDPEYASSRSWDLENINHDAQFSSDHSVRQYAIKLFGLIGAKVRPQEVGKYLLAIENTGDEAFEYELTMAHIRVSTPPCSQRAIEIMRTSAWFKTWDKRFRFDVRNIFRAIAESKSELFLEFLHEKAEQEEYEGALFNSYQEILNAIKAIGSNKSEQTVLSIIETCKDFNVSNQLILTLGVVGGSESIAKLREVIFSHDMNSDNSIYFCWHPVAFASCSLGRLKDLESVDKMVELWHNGYKSPLLARAFSLLNYEKAIPILIEGTGDRSIDIVVGSLRALGDIGGDEAKNHLLYLENKGITHHIKCLNPEMPSRDYELNVIPRAALILALNEVGKYNGRRDHLERAKRTVPLYLYEH